MGVLDLNILFGGCDEEFRALMWEGDIVNFIRVIGLYVAVAWMWRCRWIISKLDRCWRRVPALFDGYNDKLVTASSSLVL